MQDEAEGVPSDTAPAGTKSKGSKRSEDATTLRKKKNLERKRLKSGYVSHRARLHGDEAFAVACRNVGRADDYCDELCNLVADQQPTTELSYDPNVHRAVQERSMPRIANFSVARALLAAVAKVQLIKDAIVGAAGARVVESDLHDEGSCALAIICTLLVVLALLVGFFMGKCWSDYSRRSILMSGKKLPAATTHSAIHMKETKHCAHGHNMRNVDTPPESEAESEASSNHSWYIRRRSTTAPLVADTGVAEPLPARVASINALNLGFTRPPAGEKFVWIVDRAKGPTPHYHFTGKCAGLNNAKSPVNKYWACKCCYKDNSPWLEETKFVVTSPWSQFEFHNDELCPNLLAERRLMARAGPYTVGRCQPLPPITRLRNCKTCLKHVQCSSVA